MAQAIDEIIRLRIEKLEKLKNLGINPYPSKFSQPKISCASALTQLGAKVSVTGRLMSVREHGNMIFANLKDESGKIQIWFQKETLKDKFSLLKLLDVGDFIGVTGAVVKTKTEEITVNVEAFEVLSKSLRPIPDLWFGIKDEETRYRQRYLDLLLDENLRSLFYKKALFWNSMREYLAKNGFLEVETPVLETTAGGADAQPFITHHNALDIDLYLRISMGELWQKRLMVAGFEKTFEIGRQFRNEGISREHLQDYTQMEFYWAYANFDDSMRLVEEMYKYVIEKTFGTLKFQVGDYSLDFSGTWERIDYVETIKKLAGVDITKMSDGREVDGIWKGVRKQIAGPVFLTGHPVLVSPLAKRMEKNPDYVERYQVIIAGSELGNGYSELNDPIDQSERFKIQQEARDKGDEEAQMNDTEFVKALEYGMPPVSGFGVSERLFSFLCNLPIRETVLFPLLRPEENARTAQDFSKKFVVIIDKDLPAWQIMNTSGHIAAFLGNKLTDPFDTGKHFVTKDGMNMPRNSQYPVITLSATKDQLKPLAEKLLDSKLTHIFYVPEMMETTDDERLEQMLLEKNKNQIVFAGIGIYGPKDEVDELTRDLALWGK
ncbi:lysine--tRNA ligase [Candidatus Gottesmanbacteria bacterium RIFCSPHIGHO2_01_FULL_42_12]|uniref:Lysine--tRNA ligase n=1 Tax=Candidatus Gottesmanbacteria bacterium RIFCSPHIGHO2_01_FULL_42_12 TaxID=1798377 RepID=A0A1F5Z233_9BACT|nr:MAG: lysine--tRNA ligase [Candidatus Gottesmanbacteria bacterium RIFCSPHIGHO2_01_FULL_42_12]